MEEQEATQTAGEAISNIATATNLEDIAKTDMPSKIIYVDTANIILDEANNPRSKGLSADKIKELALDIASRGQIYPILAMKTKGGNYTPIDGVSRVKAIMFANEHEMTAERIQVAAMVIDADPAQAFVTAVSTFKRFDLSPIDYSNIIRKLVAEHGMSKKDVAKLLGRNAGQVTEFSQFGELRPKIQGLIHTGKLPFGVARELIGEDEEQQDQILADFESGGREKARATKRAGKQAKTAKGESKEAKVSLTMKELRAALEALAGTNLEKGEESPFSEGVQKLGKLLLKLCDGKLGEKALANQLSGVKL